MSLPHVILVPGLMCDAAVWEHQATTLQTLTTVEIPDHGMNDSLEEWPGACSRGLLRGLRWQGTPWEGVSLFE